MKIFITAGGVFWNPARDVFKKYKENIIVVHLDKRQKMTIDGVKVVKCDCDSIGLGHIIDAGFDSPYYKRLVEKKSEVESMMSDGEDVIVLGDTSIETLYILKVLQQIDKNIHLHLWTITPFKFEGSRVLEKYNNMLSDLKGIKSVTISDPFKLIEKHREDSISLNECIEVCTKIIDGLVDTYIRKVEKLEKDKTYFYDYYNDKFVYIDESELSWEENNTQQTIYRTVTTGLLLPKELLVDDIDYEEKLSQIKQPIPRVDGKKVCKELKKLRKAYADANRIPYFPEECYYEGPCAGTCLHCDEELRILTNEERDFIYYPKYEIRGDKFISKEDVETLNVMTMGYLISHEEWEKRNGRNNGNI